MSADFRDRDELSAAANLSAAIISALDDSEYLIVACSPNSAGSVWVNQEVLHFRRTGRSDRVLCVLVGGEGEPAELFPEAVRFELDEAGEIDRSRPLEPLAADLASTGDGRRAGVLKLAAALLEVPYDLLARRETARRNRRLALVATLTSIGMVLTGALAAFALFQRDEAERQQVVAETEAATLAEVVDFMVGIFEVSNPATENPATISALQILDRGSDRLNRELKDRPEIRGRLLATVGRVYFGLGQFDQSVARLQEALEGISPGTARWQEARLELAKAVFRQQRFEEAELMFAAIVEDLRTGPSGSPELRGEALRWWGALRLYQNDYQGAEQRFLDAISAFSELDYEPESQFLSGVNLANLYIDQSRLLEADKALAHSIPGLKRLLGDDHADTAYALNSLGRLRSRQGRATEGIEALQQSVAAFRRTLGPNHPDVVSGLLTLGTAMREAGKQMAALPVLEAGLEASIVGLGKDSGLTALLALELSGVLAELGLDLPRASALVDEAETVLVDLFGAASSYRMNVLLGRADIALAAGDEASLVAACGSMMTTILEVPGVANGYQRHVSARCDLP